MSAGQVTDTTRYLKRAAEQWGDRDIKSIAKREAIEFLEGIAVEHPTSANRAHAALTTMYRWAEQREIIDKSPMAGVERAAPEVKRERNFDVLEIKMIWEATEVLPYPAKQLIRTLLITGQRLGETAGMKRHEIAGNIWTIPAARTKANREQKVPLSDLAREVIAECPPFGECVFSRNGRRPFSSSGAAKAALDKQIAKLREAQGLPPMKPWVLHGLRHCVASQMADLGIERFTIERVLNHADSAVTGRYSHSDYMKFKTAALNLWAEHLRKIVSSPSPALPDNVEPLRRAVG